jgi:hypothetical protein
MATTYEELKDILDELLDTWMKENDFRIYQSAELDGEYIITVWNGEACAWIRVHRKDVGTHSENPREFIRMKIHNLDVSLAHLYNTREAERMIDAGREEKEDENKWIVRHETLLERKTNEFIENTETM